MPPTTKPPLTWEFQVHYLGQIRAGWEFVATSQEETGWTYAGVLVESDHGLVVRELTVRPILGLPDFDGDWEVVFGALAQTTPRRGVNSSVLKQFSFAELRQRLDEHLTAIRALLDRSPSPTKQASGPKRRSRERLQADLERHTELVRNPDASRGGAPPFSDRILAQQAVEYLERARKGRGHRRRLMNDWGLTSEYSVDTRRKNLINNGWIKGAGLHAEPGDALEAWWEDHPDERPRRTAADQEDD